MLRTRYHNKTMSVFALVTYHTSHYSTHSLVGTSLIDEADFGSRASTVEMMCHSELATVLIIRHRWTY